MSKFSLNSDYMYYVQHREMEMIFGSMNNEQIILSGKCCSVPYFNAALKC